MTGYHPTRHTVDYRSSTPLSTRHTSRPGLSQGCDGPDRAVTGSKRGGSEGSYSGLGSMSIRA